MTTTNSNDANKNETGEPADTAALQAEIDKWKALARKHEDRATANADAADALAQLQQESKSEADKVAERIAKLEQDNNSVRTDALRLRIAAKHKISDEDADLFLTGTDEEALTAQAKRLAAHQAEKKSSSSVVAGEGTNKPIKTGDTSDVGEFAKRLFNKPA